VPEAIQVRQNNNNEPFVMDDSAEVIDGIILAASQGALTIGAVLGEVSATPGTYKLVDYTAQDGSNIPKLLLATPDVANSISTTSNLSGYNEGMFDENQLVFADGTDIDSRLDDELMPNQTDRDFSTPAWTDVDLNAFDETDDLTITATGVGQYCTLPVLSAPTEIGRKYSFKVDVANIVATWTLQDFTGAQTLGTISADGTQGEITFTAATTGGFRLVAAAATSSGDFDNFTLKLVSGGGELMPNQPDRDFKTPVWADVDLNAFDETDDLTITATGTGQYCTLAVASAPTEVGKNYILKFDLANIATTWTLKDFTGTQTLGTISANGTQQSIAWKAETPGGFRLVAVDGSSSGDFDNFTLALAGENTDLSMRDLLGRAGLRLAPGISVTRYQNPAV